MDYKEINSVDVAAYIAKQAVIKNYYIDLTKLQNSHEKCLIRYSQKFLYWSDINNVLS